MTPVSIRAYERADEQSWLRCRALSFLGSSYYDDVRVQRSSAPQIQLVAARGREVVGVLDVEIEGDLATIDTIAVHPDHQGAGIATALLERARGDLPPRIRTLDAWTRDDEAALAWYRTHGFAESDHYLHVYKGWQDPDDGWTTPEGLSAPVTAFCHARLEDEAALRARFPRVHVCRRFSQAMTGTGAG